ncbi:MAG: hypothetical protein IKT56_03630 [Clostridia bacterium]|nr:hypothetical protein [Clostridia bacterium]
MKNFNKTKLTIIVAVALALVCSLSIFIAAATYDSTNDPLISLSYLTKYVDEALKPIRDSIASSNGNDNNTSDSAPAVSNTFEAIFVEYGQQIQCTAATEIILRSGSATVVSPFDNQGLSDLTDGVDLKAGVAVPKNHNLLIPRGNDGRGIVITSSDGAYVMVGGAYTIVNAEQ